jgi:ribosome-associated toxin RatA of RatAB toxin-antitoxin module
MFARNEIMVHASPARVYHYASDTERWPEYLPHYRYVRVLQQAGDRRVVEMAARRSGIPVRWRAEQTNDPLKPSIAFRHLGGWTKGMDVVWSFEPVAGGTRVSIDHRAGFVFPMNWIIGKFFIDHVATRTLRRMKELAESDV